MINLATLTLKAIDPTRNLNRWYVIQIGKDLFCQWSIQVIYGRSGCKGVQRLTAYDSFSELVRHLKRILVKRLHAHKRIGINYQITTCTVAKNDIIADTLQSLIIAIASGS